MAPRADSVVSLLSTLVARLLASRDFETASGHLLGALYEAIAPAVHAGGDESEPRILRGTIHYRPEDGYRRLWTREFGSPPEGAPEAEQPSLTAWRWVARRRCPVSIDVGSRLLRVFEGGTPRLIRDDGATLAFAAGETCHRLQARDVNYLHVLPIRRPTNLTDGMVSIEMRCPGEVGDALASTSGELLQLLVDLAAPHLAALPLAPVEAVPAADEFLPVVGHETARLVELLRVFSGLQETLLLTGATGVGKSRLARYCHAHSPRKNRPFVTIDLLACPENLQMAQLVGWKKGAFTGAERDSPGAIQRAEGGTLFLDEIDKLSLKEQAGLLRLLEERAYRPVGDTGDDRRADVRFIVGTNTDLRAGIRAGRFREDLYYRIAVLMVRVPPLADRIDEVPAWADYMLRRCCANELAQAEPSGSGEARLDLAAAELLQTQAWPGNLRQLDNVIRRAYAFGLVDRAQSPAPVVVSRSHVERAVAEDAGQTPSRNGPSLLSDVRAAARSYAQEVKRRAHSETPLALDSADAFRGFVLEATIKAFGNRETALEALGLGSVVKDRNHHRLIKRELDTVARFLAVAGDGPAEPTPPSTETRRRAGAWDK
ncbi:MAG: sigma-54-dependent Fis family transcriptional regulator [Polyangiaceae bacterium]|nr:sigma-54-dependent Fis family transcriptional regulator [Polyangiaceae bacterium]